jgi:uroporphyrinogen-III synthase
MPTVLITRPETPALALASLLQARGYETAIEPLLTIVSTNIPRPQDKTDLVMITSGNACGALEQHLGLIDDLFAQPCYCVGPRTAEKVRALGFQNVISTTSDGAELAHFILRQEKPSSVLHICGQAIESKAATELQKEGWRLIGWPVYAATPVTHLSAMVKTQFENKKLNAVLVFSPRMAQTLKRLLHEAALEACCKSLAAICLSDAVAAELEPLPWRRLIAASAPTEDAVIACLEDLYPVHHD